MLGWLFKKKELVVGEPLLTLAEKLKDFEWYKKQKWVWVNLHPVFLEVNDNVWTEWTTCDEKEYICSVIIPLLEEHKEHARQLRCERRRQSAMLEICGGTKNEEHF